MDFTKEIERRWLFACTALYAAIESGVAYAAPGAASADDVLGPAAKIVDQTRLSPGWGILGGLATIGMIAWGLAFKDRKALVGAGLTMAAVVVIYGGWDIIGPLVPTTGTAATK